MPEYVFDFPAFGDTLTPLQERGGRATPESLPAGASRRVLRQGPYRRTYALAQRLAGASETEEDLVHPVLTYLRRGFNYSETPPREAYNLENCAGLDAKTGYCQQFSGAMALLLRMGGVPARVVTGFTSGSLDAKTREYVVRDLDAHSWVEVWYHDIGWVTFDPTPAAAPPRSQPNEAGADDAPVGSIGPPSLGGDAPSDPGRRGLAAEEGTSWGWIAFAGIGAVALAVAGFVLFRRRRRRASTPPPAIVLAELERALRRTRRHPGPGATLASLEQRFARSPTAAGYVRAVRELRYGGGGGAPTPSQRRGLRAELSRGGGIAGRLRAWWALPPRAH